MSRCQRRRPVGFWRADAISVLKLTRTQLSARNDYKIEIKKKKPIGTVEKKGRESERERKRKIRTTRASVCVYETRADHRRTGGVDIHASHVRYRARSVTSVAGRATIRRARAHGRRRYR